MLELRSWASARSANPLPNPPLLVCLSSLVVSLGKALNGIACTFEWLDW